ncbi:MAG: hypothetical protein CM1200mP29_17500 [Verrucomicrobiota bacterium]|nr:MAG: hypothetical protein CM1200mP29_17500 [Verrucomicrobiota bacterium]
MADTLGEPIKTLQAKGKNAAMARYGSCCLTSMDTGEHRWCRDEGVREAFEAAFGVTNVTGQIKFAGRTDYSLFREMCRDGGIDCTGKTASCFSATTSASLKPPRREQGRAVSWRGRVLDELAAMPGAPGLVF